MVKPDTTKSMPRRYPWPVNLWVDIFGEGYVIEKNKKYPELKLNCYNCAEPPDNWPAVTEEILSKLGRVERSMILYYYRDLQKPADIAKDWGMSRPYFDEYRFTVIKDLRNIVIPILERADNTMQNRLALFDAMRPVEKLSMSKNKALLYIGPFYVVGKSYPEVKAYCVITERPDNKLSFTPFCTDLNSKVENFIDIPPAMVCPFTPEVGQFCYCGSLTEDMENTDEEIRNKNRQYSRNDSGRSKEAENDNSLPCSRDSIADREESNWNVIAVPAYEGDLLPFRTAARRKKNGVQKASYTAWIYDYRYNVLRVESVYCDYRHSTWSRKPPTPVITPGLEPLLARNQEMVAFLADLREYTFLDDWVDALEASELETSAN